MERLKTYYPVFKFVLIFGVLYVALSLLYYAYLQVEYQEDNYPDPITAVVSNQMEVGLNALGYEAFIFNSDTSPSIGLYIDKKIVFRVIEGCNAISVILLFSAFVIAFAKGWKRTLIFLIFGAVTIYLVNLLRLIALAVIYQEFPEYSEISHNIAFPGVIYGYVILLWIYWIKKSKK